MSHRHTMFFLLILVIFIALDAFLWYGFRKTVPKRYFDFLKWIIPLSTLLFFFGGATHFYRASIELYNANKFLNLLFGLSFGFVAVKLVATIVLLLEDVYRFIEFLKKKLIQPQKKVIYTSRRNFVKNVSLSAASLPFIGSVYAVTKGKYAFHEKTLELYSPRLPDSFDGFKVVQFTDFHAGSFDDFEKVKQGLSLINDAKPDIIVFTGDIVNNRSVEVFPFLDMFRNLEAKHGKFAVLGNHDYGDYIQFDTEEEREENRRELEDFYREAGFTLLNNENITLENEADAIQLIGVENWGTGPFPQYGNLEKASGNLASDRYTILLSHDPDHWEYEVRNHPTQYDLTLSGHTHGFQTGVNIPGVTWSPAKYRYKRWLGLYHENNRYLFVSKGFGFLGFPGRIGMTPEVVSITLRSK